MRQIIIILIVVVVAVVLLIAGVDVFIAAVIRFFLVIFNFCSIVILLPLLPNDKLSSFSSFTSSDSILLASKEDDITSCCPWLV